MSLIIAYLGILTVLVIALNARFLGEALGVMDDPELEKHKRHTISTPLIGSLLVGSIAVTIVINQMVFELSDRWGGVSTCVLLVAALGFLDDRHNLKWQLRLALIVAICGLLVWLVPEIRLTSLHWSFGETIVLSHWVSILLTVACLATLVVSFNMMDGYNGGVIGISLILVLVMALLSVSPHRQAICLFLASALGIMFVYNMKGKFFLGDGGAYALGLLVGSLALMTYNLGSATVPVYADTVGIWLMLPAVDCLRVTLGRKLRKQSPFSANRDHLHHILLDRFDAGTTLAIIMSIVGATVSLSLFTASYSFILFAACFCLYFFILPIIDSTFPAKAENPL
ncbi:MraY family glycosyltransferase [Pseudokordiimonas caeni]|uniref:MraY family glycosyltransferase n=1 Tax=Pseudokordiimonas caeni TaxID=2997908 RepID=UPI0028116EE3|nr:MraY family glycosyltransferase [Pseudokordiimonas caeni]